MYHVAFLLNAYRYQENSVSFLKIPRKRLAALLYILDGRPPSMFSLYLRVFIFHYTGSKLMARPIPVLY